VKNRRLAIILIAALPLLLLALTIGATLLLFQGGLAPYRLPGEAATPIDTDSELLARGRYVAAIGNCAGCHTARGGTPLAGGRPFVTPWGTIYSSNLTPDPEAGLGNWPLPRFQHAMRHGVAPDGVLYPAFPYANFALLDDADIRALFAWLRSVPPSDHIPPPNRLEAPAGWRWTQVVWRMLHYRPQNPDFGADMPAEWRRGRYLVDGLGHCGMCHGRRGAMGSLPASGYLAGGRIPDSGWYAPPLDGQQLARYEVDELAGYLRTGMSAHGSAYGPMGEVIYQSLQYLTMEDARAMATFLKSVPPRTRPRPPREAVAQPPAAADAAGLYEKHCSGCHGIDGEGGKDAAWPPLTHAVAITAPDPVNTVRMILYGGMAPTTPGNPQPYSMPPFVEALDADEVAAIANYVRGRFGGQPPLITAETVRTLHGITAH